MFGFAHVHTANATSRRKLTAAIPRGTEDLVIDYEGGPSRDSSGRLLLPKCRQVHHVTLSNLPPGITVMDILPLLVWPTLRALHLQGAVGDAPGTGSKAFHDALQKPMPPDAWPVCVPLLHTLSVARPGRWIVMLLATIGDQLTHLFLGVDDRMILRAIMTHETPGLRYLGLRFDVRDTADDALPFAGVYVPTEVKTVCVEVVMGDRLLSRILMEDLCAFVQPAIASTSVMFFPGGPLHRVHTLVTNQLLFAQAWNNDWFNGQMAVDDLDL